MVGSLPVLVIVFAVAIISSASCLYYFIRHKLLVVPALVPVLLLAAPSMLSSVYSCTWHDFYLVDPSKEDLRTVSSLTESKLIRTVQLPSSAECIYNGEETYCIIEFWTNTRSYAGPDARKYMDEKEVKYFRTKEQAYNFIDYSQTEEKVDKLLRECSLKEYE